MSEIADTFSGLKPKPKLKYYSQVRRMLIPYAIHVCELFLFFLSFVFDIIITE